MKEFIKKNKVNLIVMLCYSVMSFIILLFHESWRDEAQAWLIAKELNIVDFFEQMKYEGHPIIWYLILMPFAKIGLPYITVKIVSWLICNITVWLILKKAPFNIFIKILFIFSMPMLYLYPSISRSYCLIPLAIVLVAIYYKQRHEKPIQYILCILFLANTHVIMYGMVGILLLLFYIEELIKNRKTNNKQQKKKIYISLLVIIVGMILTLIPIIISMLTNTDVSLVAGSLGRFQNTPEKMESAYIAILTGCFGSNELVRNVVLIALIILLCYELRYHFKNALIIIFTMALQFLIFTYIYMGSTQKVSTFILLIMFIFWIQTDSAEKTTNTNKKDEKLTENEKYLKKQNRKAKMTDIAEYILVFLLIINIVQGMDKIDKEIKTNYSSAYETAQWINENIEKNSIFICTSMPISSAVIPYINRDSFWSPQTLDYFSFTTWDENYRTGYSLRDLQERVKENFMIDQNLYLLYSYDFNEETMNYLEEQGYITKIFESNMAVKEEYAIYKINSYYLK